MSFGGIFDLETLQSQQDELEKMMSAPGFWDDNESAQKILQKRSGLQRSIETWENLEKGREDLGVMLELFSEEEDSQVGSLLSNCLHS